MKSALLHYSCISHTQVNMFKFSECFQHHFCQSGFYGRLLFPCNNKHLLLTICSILENRCDHSPFFFYRKENVVAVYCVIRPHAHNVFTAAVFDSRHFFCSQKTFQRVILCVHTHFLTGMFSGWKKTQN